MTHELLAKLNGFMASVKNDDQSAIVAGLQAVVTYLTAKVSICEEIIEEKTGNKNVSEVFYYANQNGIAAHYDYAPFGAVIRTARNTRVANRDIISESPFRFSSEFHDDTLALVYYNYRHYDPADGRWIYRDPLGNWSNIYTVKNEVLFCNNRVYNNVDILGLLWGSINETPLPPPPVSRKDCKALVVLLGGAADDNTGVVGIDLKNKVTEDYPEAQIAYYHWDSARDAIQAVEQYLEKCPCSTITLIGHSWGGSELISTLKHLKSSPSRTTILTLDPVGRSTWVHPKLQEKDTIGQWVNVYSSPAEYNLSDFIADIGGQIGRGRKVNPSISQSSSASHGDAIGLYNAAKTLLKFKKK